MNKIAFISGHLDTTQEEFDLYYKSAIDEALKQGHHFVIGDAKGADLLAQKYLRGKTKNVTIYHMFIEPKFFEDELYKKSGGYHTDEARDSAMTKNSDYDILYVRKGKEKSGTADNQRRRYLK